MWGCSVSLSAGNFCPVASLAWAALLFIVLSLTNATYYKIETWAELLDLSSLLPLFNTYM